jgi:hypothetical protein
MNQLQDLVVELRMEAFYSPMGAFIRASLLLLLASFAAAADEAERQPEDAAAELEGLLIGNIVLDKSDVFDLTDPRENNFLYRLANKLHIVTKDKVITKQLLLKPGEPYSKRLADESERILRDNKYLYDAVLTPKKTAEGTADLHVATRDVWTLKPILSVSRRGGENKTSFGIQELNLVGRGQKILLERTEDVDRTSNTFEFFDQHLGRSWISAAVLFADSSDGQTQFLSLVRPFYALDTRWAAGMTAFDSDSRRALYDLGEEAAEYQQQRQRFSAFGGWSSGLRDGWVRRYSAGVVFDDNQFSPVVDGVLPPAVPEDREFIYPFLGIEVLQDQFETAQNREQIDRTEDFYTGTRFSATLGWADESAGSSQDALLYTASYGRGFGSLQKKALLLSASASGRQESGDSRNVLVGIDARYFNQQSDKRVFYATVSGTLGHDLDLDNVVELGGDSGLRGYPLRYQSGDSKLLLTVEQRYFLDWYPFRLFRIGGAIFADAGRTWGDNPVGGQSQGWLRDVGFGLRFASTRSGVDKIVHLDIAFPLDGDPSIDNVQILLESKKRF